MSDIAGSSRITIEHYPYNKYLVLKSRSAEETLKVNTRRFAVVEAAADSHLLTHAFKVTYKAEAIYGKITLFKHSYLIIVDKSRLVGRILGRPIFQVQSVSFVNLTKDVDESRTNAHPPATDPAADADEDADERAIQMLLTPLQSGFVFYGDRYALTNNLQSQLSEDTSSADFDPAFCINTPFSKKFLTLKGAEKYSVGFIYGFFAQKDLFLKSGKVATFTLVSRKHFERMGSRYYSRGIDEDGYVSNFAETETILEVTEGEGARRVYSHLQVRGSIPLFWTQRPNLAYTPKIQLGKSESANEQAMLLHMRRLIKKYNAVQCINLIDKKGSQLSIGSAFERVFQAIKETQPEVAKGVFLQWFDYHHETRRGKVDKLRDLLDFIKVNTANFGWLEATVVAGEETLKWKVHSTQQGVVRTNCIDCLDRTNVMQSVLSRQALHAIFAKLNLESEANDPLNALPDFFEPTFREFWAGNANTLSRLYAGTDALKTDVTRTGKRTFRGMLYDGKNSFVRYFINNLADHHTQNTLALLTDNLKPELLKEYREQKVSKFLLRVALLVLLPLLVRVLFWVLGSRCNFSTSLLLTGLSLGAAYFYVQEKKKLFLMGDLLKE